MTPQAALLSGLSELAPRLVAPLPESAPAKLMAYLELLAKWNRTHNLTAIRDPLRSVSHHLLDSLVVLPELPPGALADVGAGGGLPGIPIAIAEPARRVALNDANQKKGAFLRQAVIELGLANAEVHVGRVEEWTPFERFAVVISRGLSELGQFIVSCRHLVAPGGVLAAMKGVHPEAELAAVNGCDCSDVRRLRVPMLDEARHLVLCRPGG
ncbi:MAG: 16S rRNA (guanine(527)-N(7))-methyltransferase RsmG [Betaproteobacteria bacterium]